MFVPYMLFKLISGTSEPKPSHTPPSESPSTDEILLKMLAADRYHTRSLSTSSDSATLPRDSSAPHSFSSRDAHVKLMMNRRRESFTTFQPLRLFCGTWNVNGKMASEDLLPWFKNAITDPPAIIALGFQELDLSKEAYIFAGSGREEEWKTAAQRAVKEINPSTTYKMVKVQRLVGIMLILFVSDGMLPHVSNVAVAQVPTGIMGMLGNKGGVGIRLDVFNSSLCFVSSHLAAHVEEFERRNQDYRDISEKMAFIVDGVTSALAIEKHDMVFWLGDLNYRISGIPTEDVKMMISQNKLEKLYENDQLKEQRVNKKVFPNYREMKISFHPTYKYDVGTNDYDSSEKARCPSWTDRVLYRGSRIKPFIYASHPELMLSDHKPVSCIFNVEVSQVNWDKYRQEYEEVMKELDKLENEYLPQVEVQPLELSFGDIMFMEPVIRTIEVRNTGQVPADFMFIPKLDDSAYCQPWLTIKPFRDCILPNESTMVEMTLYVDKKTAHILNSGVNKIDDILVLHLDGGKDFFVTLNGSYTPSCFGSSLETLVRIPNPISELSPSKLAHMERSLIAIDIDNTCPIPKELWYLCDTINNRGKFEEDLFQQRGLHQEVIDIRKHLDTSLEDKLPGTIHAVAEALLIFLDSLAEPVIPYKLFDDALSSAIDGSKSIEVVSSLPLTHKRTFEYITEFMREILRYSASNNLDVYIIANVFAPILIKSDSKIESTKAEQEVIDRRKSTFLRHFL